MWPILSVELAGFDRADGLVEAVFASKIFYYNFFNFFTIHIFVSSMI